MNALAVLYRLLLPRWQLAACFSMHAVNDALFAGLYPLLPLLAADLDLTYGEVGAIKTAFSGAAGVFQVPVGLLAEALGEQIALALGTGWVAIGMAGMALVSSFWLLLVVATLAGLGGITRPAAFVALLTVGMLDAAARGTASTFLPFVLADRGADPSTTSVSFAVLFAAGAAGKLLCGPFGDRYGVVLTIALSELLTAGSLAALLVSPLVLAPVVLLPLGFVLTGTSSVLYASVADLVHPERRSGGYGVYYTGVQVASAIAPIVYGVLAD